MAEDRLREGPLHITPAVEAGVVALAIASGLTSWLVIASNAASDHLIAPPVLALLLVGDLIAGTLLLMLVGRRIARRRAARSPIGGRGQLHVRLVAIFSMVAAVPMLLVAIAASLLFQYGVQFWYSDRARSVIENATDLARSAYSQQLQRWDEATVTMSADMAGYLREHPLEDPRFPAFFLQQVYYRSLSEGALIAVSPGGAIHTLALVNPYDRDLSEIVTPAKVAALRGGKRSIVTVADQRIQIVTALPGSNSLYLYAGRVGDMASLNTQTRRAVAVLSDYHGLLVRARSLQLKFNAALLALSLFIVGVAVWIALALADRLVRPVGELVAAARRVEGGDLTARVPDPRRPDEVGTLAKAFNQMTGRLSEQNAALLSANDALDARRALIEAVMAGVSAGVVAAAPDGTIRLANASATRLLGTEAEGLPGQRLDAVAPELAALVDDDAREVIVELGRSDARTLAVRIARTAAGPILTFDDITQQLLDQRRAAWSDVARRVAHEIKNPLTPIQLAAERLQRRYGAKVAEGDGTFTQLTETIVRQVGDLRRMVDEFSSFARMPKPVFQREPLLDTARQALFLHEVAHPGVAFELVHDDPAPVMMCDRRQIGQALTNIVKNAVEAIEAKGEGGPADRRVVMSLRQSQDGRIVITVADTGVGLPVERDRIVEPYMTTRARGTGLGLAIVKKIVEEHHGTIAFSDRDGGGTVVTMSFDPRALADAADPALPHADTATVSTLVNAGS